MNSQENTKKLQCLAKDATTIEDWVNSEQYWSQVLTAKADDQEALYNLGLTHLKLGDYDESLLYIEKGMQYNENEIDFLRLETYAAYHKMDLSLAINSAKKVLGNVPNDLQVWRILLLSEILSGEIKQVRNDVKDARLRFDDDILINFIQCKVAVIDGDFNKAKSLIPFLLKNAYDEPEVIKLLGIIFIKLGDKKRAVSIYEKAFSLGVVDFDILNALGWYSLAEKQFKKATSLFENSLKLNRTQVDGSLGLGYCYLNNGQYDLAKDYCDDAKKLNSNDVRVWELCLFIAHKLDDKISGKTAYKNITRIKGPDH